ncbi:hypothetical protein GWI33_007715 [Rhynchophorus ferrugineus]|uniref:Uncharacterized protein n=1 Tax=Rhynchophorus ferrugineus TaxID=354439 RepID=A0A834IJJ6_RHYFE|nr:hypothetical protein GWI33_007715 [Rhynchophorus ferrugineus]
MRETIDQAPSCYGKFTLALRECRGPPTAKIETISEFLPAPKYNANRISLDATLQDKKNLIELRGGPGENVAVTIPATMPGRVEHDDARDKIT